MSDEGVKLNDVTCRKCGAKFVVKGGRAITFHVSRLIDECGTVKDCVKCHLTKVSAASVQPTDPRENDRAKTIMEIADRIEQYAVMLRNGDSPLHKVAYGFVKPIPDRLRSMDPEVNGVSNLIDDLEADVMRLRDENLQLREACHHVLDLAADSEGIAGYHQNGALEGWDETVDVINAALEGRLDVPPRNVPSRQTEARCLSVTCSNHDGTCTLKGVTIDQEGYCHDRGKTRLATAKP